MPIAARASLKTSRVLATSARAASARATERSEGCISANSSARPRVSRAVPQATVATMARPTSSSVAASTLKCLRGNRQNRTRKNLPPLPHRRSRGLKWKQTGTRPEPIPFGPRFTSREMICSKRGQLTAAAEGARPPSPRYRARLRFRIASCSMHPTTPAPALLGEVHRRHRAPAAALTDAELERRHGHQRPLRTNGGDPPRPPEVTLRCVRAPRRTEWIPARRVGTLRPCAVPVVGGTSRLHKRLGMPCQPAPE